MSDGPFAQFLDSHGSDLRRISRATEGEASLEDVQAEAWLMVSDLRRKGLKVDLARPDHQQLLLSHLYQHLVRYTELTVRRAVRLDHSPGGTDGEAHPLTHLLAADEFSDPLVALMRTRDQCEQLGAETSLDAHQSLASAYFCLLERLGGRMSALADHLLISLSYCYRRCAHARTLAVHQLALPSAAMVTDPGFIPGAWRRYRLRRQPVQLSFDFESDVVLFVEPLYAESLGPTGPGRRLACRDGVTESGTKSGRPFVAATPRAAAGVPCEMSVRLTLDRAHCRWQCEQPSSRNPYIVLDYL